MTPVLVASAVYLNGASATIHVEAIRNDVPVDVAGISFDDHACKWCENRGSKLDSAPARLQMHITCAPKDCKILRPTRAFATGVLRIHVKDVHVDSFSSLIKNLYSSTKGSNPTSELFELCPRERQAARS